MDPQLKKVFQANLYIETEHYLYTTDLFPLLLLPLWASLAGSDGKESVYSAGDLGWITGLGRSPEEGNGYPLQFPPVFLPGEFHGQRSLEGYSPWDLKEWDRTERRTLLSFFLFSYCYFCLMKVICFCLIC